MIGERITCSVKDASELTGLGKTTLYALLAEGKITSIRIGSKRLIHVESLHRLLDPSQTDHTGVSRAPHWVDRRLGARKRTAFRLDSDPNE